jgi:glycosyltransferase involved in cell wall biosynthesis
MKILVGQNHLDTIGGSETYTYTLIKELCRRKFNVELVCGSRRFGIMSKKIYNDFGIVPDSFKDSPDICFINHTTTVKKVLDSKISSDKIIQVCHGTIPNLEQPYGKPVENYVSISKEVQEHLAKLNHNSVVINNGIDMTRFFPTKTNDNLRNILSLSQSKRFNTFLQKICDKNGWNFKSNNKFTNPIFDIENQIKEADLVISLGRGVYEALACGKNVLVADWRPYQEPMMDALLTPDNIDEIIANNCSGRSRKIKFNEEIITNEIKKYNKSLSDWTVSYARENLNIVHQVDKMLNLKKSWSKND